MNDDQKWLEAAAGIEQDILYLRAASAAGDAIPSLDKEIVYLKVILAVYHTNAAAGVPWPSPDDLFCIDAPARCPLQVSTGMRRDSKIAS